MRVENDQHRQSEQHVNPPIETHLLLLHLLLLLHRLLILLLSPSVLSVGLHLDARFVLRSLTSFGLRTGAMLCFCARLSFGFDARTMVGIRLHLL